MSCERHQMRSHILVLQGLWSNLKPNEKSQDCILSVNPRAKTLPRIGLLEHQSIPDVCNKNIVKVVPSTSLSCNYGIVTGQPWSSQLIILDIQVLSIIILHNTVRWLLHLFYFSFYNNLTLYCLENLFV